MNEAMLTGRIRLQVKTSCEANIDSKRATSSNHMLYAGTTVTRCPKSTLNNNNLSVVQDAAIKNASGEEVAAIASVKRSKILKDRCVDTASGRGS